MLHVVCAVGAFDTPTQCVLKQALVFAFVAQARNIQGTASHLPIRHLTNSPLPFSFVWEWVHPRLLL